MQLRDARNSYDCTECRDTGGVCMQALWLGRRVARGVEIGRGMLGRDFDLRSYARFDGCGRECPVSLRIRADSVEVTCAPSEADDGAPRARVRVHIQPAEAVDA